MTYKYHEPANTGHKPLKTWTEGVPVEEAAMQQLKNLASLPFIHSHVAAMPDVHWGMGATVGSVIATKGAIIPAAVGVDIGCGMSAVRLNLKASDLPDNLLGIRTAIEKAVPHGRTDNGGENDRGSWSDVPAKVGLALNKSGLFERFEKISAKHQKLERLKSRIGRHAGTLGTGNHFIEVCLDEEDFVWVMLHSGSRGAGNAIGTYFIDKAKQDMRRWFINLPDENLAYLPEGSENFGDYIEALTWAQDYAAQNRACMVSAVLGALGVELGRDISATRLAVNCHHNYASMENHFNTNVWLTRKGAVRAREGDLGIIPGSMGARSYIVRGKGVADSFCSCSHGAGRKMSRGAAKKAFSLEDHARATAGVECRKDADVLDETPGAYKDIDTVMAAQSDLVQIVHTLKQVVCVKG